MADKAQGDEISGTESMRLKSHFDELLAMDGQESGDLLAVNLCRRSRLVGAVPGENSGRLYTTGKLQLKEEEKSLGRWLKCECLFSKSVHNISRERDG